MRNTVHNNAFNQTQIKPGLIFALLVPALARAFSNPFVLGGFGCIFVGSLFWLAVISRVHLSYAYPMLSLSYVLVVAASWLFLGEQITWMRVMGVIVIIAGVSLVFSSGQ